MLKQTFHHGVRIQRYLQTSNGNGCTSTCPVALVKPIQVAEGNCCKRTVTQRGFSLHLQRENSSVSFKNQGINRMGICGFPIPITVSRNTRNPPSRLRTPQNCRGLKVSALSLISKRRQGQKITMITAYDFPSAIHVARANIDIVLVGDSVAMVELGHVTTQPITMNDMIHHCTAVERGVSSANVPNPPLLVGDMPFGSYEFENTDIALQNAYRFVKEAGMDAVKLEGGSPARARTIRRIVDGGVAVMGHVGLTPQAISVIGGFRAQGRTAHRARELVDDALRLQDAGAFAVVIECVPENVGAAITETLEIPTIGIGAGGATSGQVLVFHDMLGMTSHPHHEQFVPKFCKRYAQLGHIIQQSLQEYKEDVESGAFPGSSYSPYVMKDDEKAIFKDLLSNDESERKVQHDKVAEEYTLHDEYEKLSLYGGSGNGHSTGTNNSAGVKS